MQKGQFLEYFFSHVNELGEPNTQGEYAVRCPFEHDKGYDQNPSAHVNLDKGIFHCKTCLAEGRFGNGGLSEVQFLSTYYNVSRRDAIMHIERINNTGVEADEWHVFESHLATSPKYLEILHQKRGLTDETIKAARLGTRFDGIAYPVFIFGELVDIRTYDPGSVPKMRGTKGSTTLMFPFDLWYPDQRPTLLVGGENDALIGRQLGFNAVTFTGGEGSVPSAMFLNMFKGRKVYICYDMDAAGQKSMQSVAFKLKEAGADVFILRLPLAGTKEDKDLSDFVLSHNAVYADVEALMHDAPQFSQIEYESEKNRIFPLIDLWDATEGRYHGRRISSRVTMAGKYDMDMYIPSVVKFSCKKHDDPEHDAQTCKLHKGEKIWCLDDSTLDDFLKLVELNEDKLKEELRRINYAFGDCIQMKIMERSSVQKVILVPDVESEGESTGFRPVEAHAYVIDDRMVDSGSYRVYYKPYGHPNDGQKAYLVIDKLEDSDNALNTFQMTPSMKQSLSVFQGDPETMMEMRFMMAKRIVASYTKPMIVQAVDLAYHSPLSFYYGQREIKGYPEISVIGESRTGKSSAYKALQRYYQLGNHTSLKSASVAGLLGGADKAGNTSWRIKWGVVPRNHKGLLVLDEASGISKEIMAHLTDMRSEGVATITKMGTAKAPAKTRLLWVGNPRQMGNRIKPLTEYPSGIDAVLDLIGSDEDVARFDAVMLVVDEGDWIKPEDFYESGIDPHPREDYANLIRWCWSRKPEQVVFDEHIKDYIWNRALVLNELYATDVKLLGAESHYKLARLAVSCAGCCFSTDDTGEQLIVRKEHVDWAEDFLRRCYDNPVFRLQSYVESRRRTTTVTPEIEHVVHGMLRNDRYATIARELLNSSEEIRQPDLRMISGLSQDDFASAISYLTRHYLIRNTSKGVSATLRLRKCADTFVDTRLKSLAERG